MLIWQAVYRQGQFTSVTKNECSYDLHKFKYRFITALFLDSSILELQQHISKQREIWYFAFGNQFSSDAMK